MFFYCTRLCWLSFCFKGQCWTCPSLRWMDKIWSSTAKASLSSLLLWYPTQPSSPIGRHYILPTKTTSIERDWDWILNSLKVVTEESRKMYGWYARTTEHPNTRSEVLISEPNRALALVKSEFFFTSRVYYNSVLGAERKRKARERLRPFHSCGGAENISGG